MDLGGIVQAVGKKTTELADEAARNFGCTSAKAFLTYNKKYLVGAAGIGVLAWLLLRRKK